MGILIEEYCRRCGDTFDPQLGCRCSLVTGLELFEGERGPWRPRPNVEVTDRSDWMGLSPLLAGRQSGRASLVR